MQFLQLMSENKYTAFIYYIAIDIDIHLIQGVAIWQYDVIIMMNWELPVHIFCDQFIVCHVSYMFYR